MNNKLRIIINKYGIKKQLKHFQSEVFECTESILEYENKGVFENVIETVRSACSTILGVEDKNYEKEHIKEEIADVMVMLKQFQLYYNIPSEEIKEVMKFKIDRQLERMAYEPKHSKEEQINE